MLQGAVEKEEGLRRHRDCEERGVEGGDGQKKSRDNEEEFG